MSIFIVKIFIDIFVILFAVSIHETAHGYAAYFYGDSTAYNEGRLTLNPVKHIDPIGSIIVPAVLVLLKLPVFGWAKPVPVNPANFRGGNIRRKMAIVSIAGPLSNFSVAIISGVTLRLISNVYPSLKLSISLGNFPHTILGAISFILFELFLINAYLGIFNLIPIPPLDGGHFLEGILPYELAYKYSKIEPYGFIILLALIYTGLFRYFVYPLLSLFFLIIGV